MKKELNISEILKGKPKGVRLYSPIFSDCTFSFIQGVTDAICVIANNNREFFDYKGLYSPTGERLLFPSKLMRNWSKFQWKKGDVLVSNDGGTEVIFDKWYDDTYTNFYGKHYLDSEDENNIKYNEAFLCTTERYSLEDKGAAQTYINTIEERFGGKLNRETLEIEPAQPEFKDGDIVRCINGTIVLIKEISFSQKVYFHAYMVNGKIYFQERNSEYYDHIGDIKRVATEEEKQQLFDAIAKEGKAWDAEKKAIVDLKPKVELKPFDKVLVRNDKEDQWSANIFSYQIRDMYYCLGECYWKYCIPYKGNESLLGTTKDVEG